MYNRINENTRFSDMVQNEGLADYLPYLVDLSWVRSCPSFGEDKPMGEILKEAWVVMSHEFCEEYNMLLSRRESGKEIYRHIYTDEEIAADSDLAEAVVLEFMLDDQSEKRPVVLICPGGGYNRVGIMNEGVPIAMELNRRGYNAVVLRYRTGRYGRFPAPMQDASRAMAYIRANEGGYNADTEKLSLWGGSAGGHLAAYMGAKREFVSNTYKGTLYYTRPDSLMLMYAVVQLGDGGHRATQDNLAQGTPANELDILSNVDASYPPCFIWHCLGDDVVDPQNSRALDARLSECGVQHQLALYPAGGHGIWTTVGTPGAWWLRDCLAYLESIGMMREVPSGIDEEWKHL